MGTVLSLICTVALSSFFSLSFVAPASYQQLGSSPRSTATSSTSTSSGSGSGGWQLQDNARKKDKNHQTKKEDVGGLKVVRYLLFSACCTLLFAGCSLSIFRVLTVVLASSSCV